MKEDYLTVTEAAAILGVTTAAIRKRLDQGVMRGERIHPRLWMIPREEVERWRALGRLPRGPKPGSRRHDA